MKQTAAALALAATALLAGHAPARAQQYFPTDAEIREMARSIPRGAGVALVIGLLEADGTRRVITVGEGAYDGSTIFELASVTKVFTGLLLAEMVQRGEVRLDQPVAELLGDSVRVPSRGRQITLVDLSTHTSGLPRVPANLTETALANPYAAQTPEAVYAFLAGHELTRDVGAEYEYSNLGVGLLGHALATHAGMTYEALLTERVIAPLGLHDTGITLDDARLARLARGHAAPDRTLPVRGNWERSALTAAGALRSTADDLLTLLEANIRPPAGPLGDAIRATHESYFEPRGGGMQHGLGWARSDLMGTSVLQHGGAISGYRTMIGLDPERGVGVVLLINSNANVQLLGAHLLAPGFPLLTPTSANGYGVLILALALAIALAVLLSRRRTGAGKAWRYALLALLATLAWLFVTLVAGVELVTIENGRAAAALALLAGIGAALVIARSATGARLAAGLPLAMLVGMQSFRLLLELLLNTTYSRGRFPGVLSVNGYTFEAVFGALSLVLALLVGTGRAGAQAVRVWNVLGCVSLLNFVLLAWLNPWFAQNLFVLTPGFLIPMAVLGHALVARGQRDFGSKPMEQS